jgi:ABC-2 type transport system ATP-binding protein
METSKPEFNPTISEVQGNVAIEVKHLHKKYGPIEAVNDVTFSVKKGEIFGVIGPNGAGKTTTVECISGLRKPDSGTISVMGMSPEKDRASIRRILGVQLQESALPPRIRVGEAVELLSYFYPNPMDVDDLLELLGIIKLKKSIFKNLSGGEKQRLSIALALVGNPQIAILDELTTGLDPGARREAWDLIDGVRKRGVTIVLVTHFMDEAERLCDRLAMIHNGKIIALDTPEAVASKSGGKRLRFTTSMPVEDTFLLSIPGVMDVERKEKYITVNGTGDLAANVIYALFGEGVMVSDIEATGGNLDEAFISLSRENEKMRAGSP